jgi:hypothetical protein
MQTLSEYLKNYIIDVWFTSKGKAQEGETFEDQLKRIIHEGIFQYRKSLSSQTCYEPAMAIDIFNALMRVENKEDMNLFRK